MPVLYISRAPHVLSLVKTTSFHHAIICRMIFHPKQLLLFFCKTTEKCIRNLKKYNENQLKQQGPVSYKRSKKKKIIIHLYVFCLGGRRKMTGNENENGFS